jgi:hypothetical protein
MNHSERFRALFSGKPVDRVPLYFFGSWKETKLRWKEEGLDTVTHLGDPGPQVPGMDPDWEDGMWDCHGLVYVGPIGDRKERVIEETEDTIVYENAVGDIIKDSKLGSTITHALRYGLEPTWESWEHYKRYLNPKDPRRRGENWEQKADELAKSGRMLAFMGGSLYGWLRNWMGIENISFLMYDDPDLFQDMVHYLTDYFIELLEPVVKRLSFDLVYFFEDCCGVDGPLFSPAIYREVLDPCYRRLLRFYKENGVAFSMMDSDGKVDQFIPLWRESGFDIIFPIEVGTWKASPVALREKFGADLKMLGGVDKHVISQGEDAIRAHLLTLKPAVDQGGYLPIPDHRIPPECSLEDFKTYLRVFNEVFNGVSGD